MGQLRRDIIRRHGLAASGALVFSLLFLAGYYLQLTRLSGNQLVLLLGSFWLIQAGLLYWVCSGRAERCKDPSLTVPFMLLSISYFTIMLMSAPALRPVLLLAYLTVMPFGVFRLTWKGYLGVGLFTMACYTSAILYFQLDSGGLWIPQLEAFLGITFFACIMAYTVMGREFTILRDAYRRKNRELRRAMVRIEELAVTDELTGLFNRRYLLRTLEKQRALAEREGLPFVLAFVDIDHFKQINDLHGHKVGDQVLAELSAVLKMSIREVDLAARYGGEEFVLLLSGLALADAGQVLERIRLQVMERAFSQAQIPLTVSIGVAQYHPGDDADELLNRADRLLYDAKRGGRNQVKTESRGVPVRSLAEPS